MSTDLTPLLRYCPETTAAQLSAEFCGVFSPDTVRRYVESSHEQLGDWPTTSWSRYHHVWELIEKLAPVANLTDLHRPTGGKP